MAKGKVRINQPVRYLNSTFKKEGKKYTTFLKGLLRRRLRGLDGFAIATHKEAFKKIDCLDCANCCKLMSPTYNKADIKRISRHLGMSYDEYFKKYLYFDETGDIMNRRTPCQFLQKDNKCSIYPVRPKDCSGYPHTQNRDWKLYISGTHIQNMEYCPAVMNMVESMYKKIITEGKWNLTVKDAGK
ncbi:MAG: YkgJ family cysteine cluster protein [Bacteroidia bacterium]|nr:YkgJ family cysteine cluster protein [Bacteroidia bacterium]